MSTRSYQVALIAVLLFFAGKAQAAEFTVDSWDLGISVGAGFPNSVGSFFNQVQSPFVASHSVTLLPNYPNSTASASYDFAFDETAELRRFLIESTLSAEGVSQSFLNTDSTAVIVITPLIPITVQVHGEYTYDIPGDPMFSVFQFDAFSTAGSQLAFIESHAFSSSMGTGSDTFFIDGEFVLLPTHTWRLRTTMNIQTSPGSLGHLGTGSGFMDIQIVPEPDTLFLITAMLPFLRRSHRASGKTKVSG